MPVIYIWSTLLHGDMTGVLIEVAGAIIFMGLAVFGGQGFYFAMNVGARYCGARLAWDSWHHNHSTYMVNWYSVACLLIDIALGFVVLTQLKAHLANEQRKSPQTR